jgi:calcineurin-like phosphoesterase family protein
VRKVIAAVLAGLTVAACPLHAEARAKLRPSISLSVTRGQPGAHVAVRGVRFKPRARAAISFAGRRLRTFRDGPKGKLKSSFLVPKRAPGLYWVRVWTGRRAARKRFRVLAAAVASPPAPVPEPVPETPAKTLAATGDIACRPGDPYVPGPPGSCHHAQVADLVASLHPDVVAPLGDNQYQNALASDFAGSYDPTWGRFNPIVHAVVGNHEYTSSADHTTATPYFDYFGATAGDPAQGYYAYEIGDGWTGIVLNSGDIAWTHRSDNSLPDDCFPVSCKAGQPQEQWLRNELDSLPDDRCVVAFVHAPRYSSGNASVSDNPELRDLYDALYDGGVELLLNGHVHTYERFPPMNADGAVDPQGVVEITVGTGGRSRANPPASFPLRSLYYLPPADGYGVLELRLSAGHYGYRFVREGGGVADGGSGGCHGRPQP